MRRRNPSSRDFFETPEFLILAGLGLLWFLGATNSAAAVGQAAANAAASAAGGVVAGGVEAIGSVVGVPATSMTQCQTDIANGDQWSASFDCPAGTFISTYGLSDYLKTTFSIL